MPRNQLFQFKASSQSPPEHSVRPWKVLSVEDDGGYQSSLCHALSTLRVEQRPVEVLKARSAMEAARILPDHPDISVILLDVVMEDDDAGLKLVGTIRETIGNHLVRIVLLTGQPGMAPRTDVMSHLDIDDYWCKSELDHDHLISILNGNIRTWERARQLEKARQGLQILIEASQSLSRQRDLHQYTQAVLMHLSILLDVEEGGIVCALQPAGGDLESSRIVAATGSFGSLSNYTLHQLRDPDMRRSLTQALETHQHVFAPTHTLLNFAQSDLNDSHYLVLIKTGRQLEQSEINLLEVFCENIDSGFRNLSLYKRLNKLAYQDPLLDIPNRNYLKRVIRDLSQAEAEQHQLLAVKLHELNEAALVFGESFCDKVLSALIERLRALSTHPTLIARLDRYDFALLAPIDSFTSELPETLQAPLIIEGATHRIQHIAALVKLSDCPGCPPEQLLRLGELSVASAARDGKRFAFYNPGQEQSVRKRQTLLDKLKSALENQAFSLALQPKVCLKSGQLKGFEALARWTTDDGSSVSPGVFVPLAETAGLITELDLQVLDMTLDVIQQLIAQDTPLPVAFNTSTLDLLNTSYMEVLLTRIEQSGIEHHLLDMEITETQVMEEYEQTAEQLALLRQLGIGISIDDFGTGYSSLAHITDLPASTLKIDQTFVRRLGESEEATHVVEMILRLSERFGFDVVAEGIETRQQLQLLQARGCQLGQGYLFARPMPVAEALQWAQEHHRTSLFQHN
ncbi:EAL domain-containing protein [Marinobacterium stanieri]|uniref:EAL domain, c-di-GMP-specific phosphodiesterase class I (Or its enzymatically inactive variant) n=1 Tax=Marinobacterium stanieri TaxID=49186 RepID=A0A1N6SZN5_9GAMM|nr:EAL domain-containing protein [Marinobacterium stanieri]SIQ46615.1 EAL domain, c-di-GMP-specific phosphodiesterase class I (or its enzymatically inactive variant) [Marinobacterium stanieri]